MASLLASAFFFQNICNGCGMPTEDAYSSGHLVLSHFGTCMCSNVETNLSWTCLVSGPLKFEHPSVLLFCFFWYFCDISFQLFKLLCLAKNHWWGFCTRNAHMVHIANQIRFKMVYTSWFLFIFQPLHSLGECHCWGTREIPWGHMHPSSIVDFSWFVAFREHQHFHVEIYWKCNFWGLFTIPFGLNLFWHFRDISFQLFSYFG